MTISNSAPSEQTASAIVEADGKGADRYLHHLAHLDIPLQQKRELVGVIGKIMCSFVDRAWGIDAVQLALKDGDEIHAAREARLPAVVSSADHNNPGERALSAAFKKRAVRERRKEKR